MFLVVKNTLLEDEDWGLRNDCRNDGQAENKQQLKVVDVHLEDNADSLDASLKLNLTYFCRPV